LHTYMEEKWKNHPSSHMTGLDFTRYICSAGFGRLAPTDRPLPGGQPAGLFAHFGSGSTTDLFCAGTKRRTPVTPSRDTL
jgi:hypothetical protein